MHRDDGLPKAMPQFRVSAFRLKLLMRELKALALAAENAQQFITPHRMETRTNLTGLQRFSRVRGSR